MKKVWENLSLVLVIIIFLQNTNALTGTLKVTSEHPFLINGKWIPASQLKVGDLITAVNGKKAKITSINDFELYNPFNVYNLEAGIYHDFVVGPGDLVAHNSDSQSITISLLNDCFLGDTLINMFNNSKKSIHLFLL